MRGFPAQRAALPLIATVLALLLLAGSAGAQGPADTTLELRLPSEASVGQEMTVNAFLMDEAGVAVAGAEVVFLREVDFLNTPSELELGRAVTDEQGVAAVSFVPRSEGEMLIMASFDGNSQYGPAFASGTAQIATGPALYSEEAGVKVPGINVSLLASLLGGVWGTYFAVMALIWLIARQRAVPSSAPYGRLIHGSPTGGSFIDLQRAGPSTTSEASDE